MNSSDFLLQGNNLIGGSAIVCRVSRARVLLITLSTGICTFMPNRRVRHAPKP